MKKVIVVLFLSIVSHLYSQETNYTIKNLSDNTENSDFGLTFYGDSTVVYASSRRIQGLRNKKLWKENKQPYLELYTGKRGEDGEIIESRLFSSTINSKYHESNVSFSKDLKTVYFSRNNSINGIRVVKDEEGWGLIQLYKATISDNGNWSEVTAMPFNDDNYQTGHPSLNALEDKLYFTSDMPGGYGLTDIYVVDIHSDGSYGTPKNLGAEINTAGREMFPFMAAEGVLYFSSDSLTGNHGGLDVYGARLKSNNFETPVNLGAPINSPLDDLGLVFESGKRSGYFSSNRKGGKGDDDIYYFNELHSPLPCYQLITGVVKDKKTGALLPGTTVYIYEGEEEVAMIVADAAAVFSIDTLTCESTYKIVGSKETYLDDQKEVTTSAIASEETRVTLLLSPPEFVAVSGKCIVSINPIFFDFDKSNIREDAAIELEKVVAIMKKYPELIIEGGSHTDSRGGFSYNERLSARRAKSTVDYIIRRGIPSNRISSRGYGESQLVNKCSNGVRCTEVEHQYNRRTEFMIVNFNDIKDKYPEICAIKTVAVLSKIVLSEEFEFDGDVTMIRLPVFHFETDDWELTPIIIQSLDKMIETMTKYPKLIIAGGVHTDSRAASEYNKNLTAKRAASMLKYLLDRGIASNRISITGYGEEQLTNRCKDGVACTEFEHNKNKRTEFIVTNPEVIK